MLDRIYADHAWDYSAALLAIDSPTGYTAKAAQWVKDAFSALGFAATTTVKGGVLVDLGGSDANDALLLAAHADTLGGMVAVALEYRQESFEDGSYIEDYNSFYDQL